MVIRFGRDICGDLPSAERREWLVTNGIGGYASGTVAGLLTRRYHGVLVAALEPPLGRTLLVSKLEETASYNGQAYDAQAYDAQAYDLGCDRWVDGIVSPQGYRWIEQFELEGTVPVWRFAIADALLEKRLWMQPGANTTYVCYTLLRGSQPLRLQLKALVNYRDYHSDTQVHGQALGPTLGWQMRIEPLAQGVGITAGPGKAPFYLLADRGEVTPEHTWFYGFDLAVEHYRGLGDREDHLHAATVSHVLQAGESLTLVASTEPNPNLDGATALQQRREYEQAILDAWQTDSLSASADPVRTNPVRTNPVRTHAIRPYGAYPLDDAYPLAGAYPLNQQSPAPDWIRQLVLAADQFIVARASAEDPSGKTVIAGYPWFGDWGRDTMIALPGLTLSTGRPAIARSILLTFARHVNQGMLPNRFPDAGLVPEYLAPEYLAPEYLAPEYLAPEYLAPEYLAPEYLAPEYLAPEYLAPEYLAPEYLAPEYNTVDATLWYFEAIRAYHAATGDDDLLRQLVPVLTDIIDWHIRGTRYCIRMDPGDGLLYAGEPGVQLTWMDAKVGDWVVTPRIGKPVEVNALWYAALRSLAQFARQLGHPAETYDQMGDRVAASFQRFWNSDQGYCYDVLDGPPENGVTGNDPALRPNQIFAVSLPNSPLTPEQQKQVVEVCGRYLLTSHGLRSLAPTHSNYQGRYGGNQHQRDGAYHQGTVWSWLLGPYAIAHWRVFKDPDQALQWLQPMAQHLQAHGLGSISEIFDGDAPFLPRGCIAQAWSVAEILRAWTEISRQSPP